MLRNLSRLLTPPDPASPVTGDDPDHVRAALRRALADRAAADARARQAEAALRGAVAPQPDPARGESWAMRPAAWSQAATFRHLAAPPSATEIAPGLVLFHDCGLAELTVRQRLGRYDAAAAFEIALDVLRFQGSFLSLCLNLEGEAVSVLSDAAILRVDLEAEMEAPVALYARLNMVQGPNRREMLAQFPFDGGLAGREQASFDLALAGLDDAPVDSAWLDLIVEKPAMNALILRDLVISRAKRAAL